MFESVLEAVLQRVLGKYIQGLNAKDLDISVWKGDVRLQNVKLRPDIFQQFGIPLEVIVGLIGNLQVTVPWKSIGSKPLDVVIENVFLIVRPITDPSRWEYAEKDTFAVKQAYLNTFAHKSYSELIKSKEELQKDASMMQSLITKVIDNLQVTVKNVHLRIENKDPDDEQCTFSLGVTLGQLKFHTTDQDWNRKYVDRTTAENADLPLNKLLEVCDFAIYFKTQESEFLGTLDFDQQLQAFQSFSQSGKIGTYRDHYLLEPIQLTIKLRQYDPAQALHRVTSALTLSISLEDFSFKLQKCQYDNLQRLIDLTNDYVRFCTVHSLREKQAQTKALYDILSQEGKVASKADVCEIFQTIFRRQLDVLVKIGLEEKKREDLAKAQLWELEQSCQLNLYSRILSAIDQEDLNTWAQTTTALKANTDRQQKEEQKRKSFFSFLKDEDKKAPLISEVVLQRFESRVEANIKLEEQIREGQYAQRMQSIPKIQIVFQLKHLTVTLVNTDGSSMRLYNENFELGIGKFDTANKYNKRSLAINLVSKAFGLNVVSRDNEVRPFVHQLSTCDNAIVFEVSFSNLVHKQSDLPLKEIDTTDLNLAATLRPIEIVYQATALSRLTKFFKVENMNDYAKIAARKQFSGLSKQVEGLQRQFDAVNFKNNRIQVKVDAPCLVIPFDQTSRDKILQGECWVFTMGDAHFHSMPEQAQSFSERFELKVQRVKFEHVNKYSDWLENKACITTVLSDFTTSVEITRQRDESKLHSLEAKKALRATKSPRLQIQAKFDSDILVQVRTQTFVKLCQIQYLLLQEAKPDQFYIDQMNATLKKSHLACHMKRQNRLLKWVSGTGCLMRPDCVIFFDPSNIQDEFAFAIDGLDETDSCVVDGQELSLRNRFEESVKFMLPSAKSALRWQNELFESAREIKTQKSTEVLLTEQSQEREETKSQSASEYIDLDQVNLQFDFEASSIGFRLITDFENSRSWALSTHFTALKVSFQKRYHDQSFNINIKSLKVTDNSDDERFACIFENIPLEGQQDLVTLHLQQISPTSPSYGGLDNDCQVSFGGLLVYWKPRCVIYLIKFLNIPEFKRASSKVSVDLDDTVDLPKTNSSDSNIIETRPQQSCRERPETFLRINVNFSGMRIAFIHPENHSYPIFTVQLNQLGIVYQKKWDHSETNCKVGNLQFFDNTGFPNTLDPHRQYSSDEPLVSNEILGVTDRQSHKTMLEFDIVLFSQPGETGCCPLQPSKDFYMTFEMDLQQISFTYMHEQFIRILDYIFNHIQDLLILNIYAQPQPADSQQEIRANASKWRAFDLQEQRQGEYLAIKVQSPIIKLPNIKSGTDYFALDLGTVNVCSRVERLKGRWLNFPDKEIFCTTYLVTNDLARFYSVTAGKQTDIFKENSLTLSLSMPNRSPYLLNDRQEDERIRLNKPLKFDQSQVDSSVHTVVGLTLLKVVVDQSGFMSLFDMINNNFFYNDAHTAHFVSTLITQADSQVKKVAHVPQRLLTTDKMKYIVTVRIGCLSLEMWTQANEMLCEVCGLNLSLAYEFYKSHRRVINVEAGTLFMFHDESDQVKQVMLGHLDAFSYVKTDREFYEKMPLELQSQSTNFKLSIQLCQNSDYDVVLNVSQVKVYLRFDTLIEVSKFLIRGLEKLDLSYAKDDNQPKEQSSGRLYLQVLDSLVILDNQDVSRKCIVLQCNTSLVMKLLDKKLIRQSLQDRQMCTFFTLKLAVSSLAAFFCDLDDIARHGYTKAEKRDLMHPLEMHLDWEKSLQHDCEVTEKSEIQCELADTVLKFSIDELLVFKYTVQKHLRLLLTLSQVWLDHTDKKQVTRQIFEQKRGIVRFFSNDRQVESFTIEAQRSELQIINEQNNGYIPLFYGQCQNIKAVLETDSLNKSSVKFVQLEVGFDYFHPQSCCYEPILEKVLFEMKQVGEDKASETMFNFREPINLNLTLNLFGVIRQFQKLQKLAEENTRVFKGNQMQGSQDDLVIEQEFNSQSLISHKQIHMSAEELSQKLASPYAIRNLTNAPLHIFKIDKYGKQVSPQFERLDPDQLKRLILPSSSKLKSTTIQGQGTQMDLFVRLGFTDANMRPVQCVNLNKNNSYEFHNAFGSPAREVYVLQNMLEDNRRVLSVRTLHILRNQTRIVYNVRLFYVAEGNHDKLVTEVDNKLMPGQSMPLPDNADETIRLRTRICIRPTGCRKWSQEFKLQAVKDKILPEHNVVWQHHDTYSILRKIPTINAKVFDFVLQPPLILKNCLPCPISVGLCGTEKSINTIDVKYSEQILLEKQEERFIHQIKCTSKTLKFTLNFPGDQFNALDFTQPTDQAKEGDFGLTFNDLQGRSMQIRARIDTKAAGLRIIFYCQNVLICRTQEALTFSNSKNASLPAPVLNEKETTVYIFDTTPEVYVTLAQSSQEVKRDKMNLGPGGSIGDITVQSKDKKHRFNYAYSSRIAQASESEFISTKIVEVTPQFVLCNLSTHKLIFQQEKAGHIFTLLYQGNRAPYHWTDGNLPLLIKFKPYSELASFCPSFNLTDFGQITVACCFKTKSGDTQKVFFRVTKRTVNATVFVAVQDSETPPYLIKNQLQNVTLTVKQAGVKSDKCSEMILAGQDAPFAWDNFELKDPLLDVSFSLRDTKLSTEGNQQFNLDDLQNVRMLTLAAGRSPSICIFVSTYKDASSIKVIEFGHSPAESLANVEIDNNGGQESKDGTLKLSTLKNDTRQSLILSVTQISIACIGKATEIIVVVLHDLQLKQVKSQDSDTVTEAYLGRIQVDNSQRGEPLFPVVLHPVCLFKEAHDHYKQGSSSPIIQFYLRQRENMPGFRYIEMVEFLVQELEVKLELDHLYRVMEWCFALVENLNETAVPFVFLKESDAQKTWRNEGVLTASGQTIYIKNYRGSPLRIELTLFQQTETQEQIRLQQQQQANIGIVDRLSNFGVQLTSINKAPIRVTALEMKNVFGAESDVVTQLSQHYRDSLKYNILRALISSDLIGNPYNFVSTLGSGVKKVYYEPRDGFMRGPIQGGLGVLKGVGGLVGGVGASVSGSIGKVTSALNKGIVAASFDRDYVHEKEINDIRNKPQNTLQGFGQGIKGFGVSIFSGVTGVISKPLQGASQDGVGGFVKGVGQGFAGLVAKPVSGVVDLVSYTTQGVEAHITGNSLCPQNMQRLREPRAFYKSLGTLKPYDTMHAKIFALLQAKRTELGPFYGAYKCSLTTRNMQSHHYQTKIEVLVINQNRLLSLNEQTLETVWSANTQELIVVEYTDTCVLFTVKRATQMEKEQKQFRFGKVQDLHDCQSLLEEVRHALLSQQMQH